MEEGTSQIGHCVEVCSLFKESGCTGCVTHSDSSIDYPYVAQEAKSRQALWVRWQFGEMLQRGTKYPE